MCVLCLEVHLMKNGKRCVGLSIWECPEVCGTICSFSLARKHRTGREGAMVEVARNEGRDVGKARVCRTAGAEPLFTLHGTGKASTFFSRENICPYLYFRRLASSVV